MFGINILELVGIEYELLTSDNLSLADEGLIVVFSFQLEADKELLVAMMSQYTGNGFLHSFDSNNLTLLGSYAADIHLSTMPKCHTVRTVASVMTFSCTTNKPLQLQVVKILEEVLVIDFDASVLEALITNPHILIVVLHLIGMWIQSAVRSYDAVAVEVVVRGGIASVVAAIGEYFLAGDRTLVAQALVHEVPNEAALVFGIFTHKVPVLFETTHRITHGVGIFALNERTGVIAFRILLAVTVVVIHRTENVGLAPITSLFILHRTIIYRLDPLVALLEVRTVASFVTHTPDDNTWMIA